MCCKPLLLVSLMSLFYTITYSQGFQVNFQGQKQQGMASAGSALPIDGSVVFQNPGAMPLVKENEISAGFTPVFANILFEENGSDQIGRTNSPMGTPFSAYALFKPKKETKWAAGLAIYTPFGSTVQWEDGWIGRFALNRLQLKAVYIQPTFAYQLTNWLSMGGGVVYATGNVNLQKTIPVEDVSGQEGLAELDGKSAGWGYNLGVHLKPTEKLGIGLTYRSQIDMKVNEGSADFTVPTSLEANFPDGTFASQLPLPQVATLGLAYTFSDRFTAVFDANWIGWKAYDTLAFDYAVNTPSLVDTKSARNYENAFSLRLGAQYNVTNWFTARAGIAYGKTPVQDGFLTPETPDANRLSYTAGCSATIGKHWSIDVSVLYVQLSREDTNLETGLSGKFSTKVVAPGIGLAYKFQQK